MDQVLLRKNSNKSRSKQMVKNKNMRSKKLNK